MTRGRTLIVIVVILSLIAAHFSREWARRQRLAAAGPTHQTTGGGTMAGMDSFALALLLGGLRGPLVMILWSNSESQKNAKDLEGVDTQIEWIRMLQPEFDTVHIFQMWNKAYNLSVQMASLANKYITILDAIEYGESVDRERPENINILTALGHTYFEKLGNSTEKAYYRKRVRQETLPHKEKQRLQRADPEWRRLQLDARLDDNGYILPQYLNPLRERPSHLPPDSEWNNGAELQHIERFQPFRYGLSTFGLAYAYNRRAQVLQAVYGQNHAQLSPMLIDSRPGLTLKNWSEEEREFGRRAELRAFDIAKPESADRSELELDTARSSPSDPIINADAAREAVFDYDQAAKIASASIAEYEKHLAQFRTNAETYLHHIDDMKLMQHFAQADRDYIAAMLVRDEERSKLLAAARDHYLQAADMAMLIVLRYYVPDPIVARYYPKGVGKGNIVYLPLHERRDLYGRVARAVATEIPAGFDAHAEDRPEYLRYLERIRQRMQWLQ